MRVIVTGASGQLGYDIIKQLNKNGDEAFAADLPEVDVTDEACVEAFFESVKPDAVIHCAAYTNVDGAETDKELCRKINYNGSLNVAEAAEKHGAKMVYISTDYVFDGKGDEPFETDSPKAPCNHYGLTKLEGEIAALEKCSRCFAVRISWVFGINGKNFVKTMLRLAKEREELTVVCDQIGSPTYTPDLSRLICEMIKTEKYGVYHATNENFCSWADFASVIMKTAGEKTRIIPVASSEYKTVAVRPLNSRMSKKSLDDAGFERLPSWQDALGRFIKELSQN